MSTAQLEEVPCDYCGERDFSVIYRAKNNSLQACDLKSELYKCTAEKTDFRSQLVSCRKCMLVMINPRPRRQVLHAFAQEIEDEVYEDEKEGRFRTYRKAISELDRLFSPSRDAKYLDLSCYSGFFVETLLAKGREATGVDICEKIVQKGNQRLGGERLYAAQVSSWPAVLPDRKFDIVTSWDAIEHVDSPTEYLQAAHSLLKDGGVFALSTMDYSSFFARITGRKWPWLMPMHLYYFTPETLRASLEKAGFEVVQKTTYTHIISLGYLFYKLNKGFLGRVRNKPIFRDIFAPIDLGDFMTLYARKRPTQASIGQ